jgi:uncharacterized membrane protein (DUF485 family)
MADRQRKLELLNDPEFKDLVARKTAVSVLLTVAMLIIYYGFIFLLAFKKEVFAYKITANIPVGIPVGVAVIVSSFILTGIYVRWANVRYDAMVRSVKNKVENEKP